MQSKDNIIYKYKRTRIAFKRSVIKELLSYRQSSNKDPERAGLLFGVIKNPRAIEVAEGIIIPSKKATRSSHETDLEAENSMIAKKYATGLHFLGTWHTHPEPFPTPSSLDLKSMISFYKTAKHDLPFFLKVIIGETEDIQNLYVAIVNKNGFHKI